MGTRVANCIVVVVPPTGDEFLRTLLRQADRFLLWFLQVHR